MPQTPNALAKRDPTQLTPNERTFVAAYLGDRCASRAYRVAYPGCTQRTSEVNGCQLLRKARVAAAIAEATTQQVARLQMDGDEAVERITRIARSEITDFFDPETGELLPTSKWPAVARLAVRKVRTTKTGQVFELSDNLRALELITKITGRLKDTVRVEAVVDALSDEELADRVRLTGLRLEAERVKRLGEG